MNKLRPITANN